MTPESEKILEQLRQIKPLLKEKWGITRLRVFGSVARGEAGPDSDVDLIADFEKTPGWEYFSLNHDIGLLLNRDVDIMTENSIHELLKTRILREARDV